MLSDGDLNVRFGRHTKKSLPYGDGLLVGVESNGEYLLRSFELTDEAPELALLLLARLRGRTEFARWLGSLVHERRVGFTNCDHRPNLSPSPRPAWDQIADCFDDTTATIPLPCDMTRRCCRFAPTYGFVPSSPTQIRCPFATDGPAVGPGDAAIRARLDFGSVLFGRSCLIRLVRRQVEQVVSL